jgi:hypothetical protein
MANKVCFTGFDPFMGDSPELCDLCSSRPPIFKYQCSNSREREQCEYLLGFCCQPCTQRLLDQLQQSESREWAEEESALNADESDVKEFHRRRVAAFGIK